MLIFISFTEDAGSNILDQHRCQFDLLERPVKTSLIETIQPYISVSICFQDIIGKLVI